MIQIEDKPTILSNLRLYFAAHGRKLEEFVTITKTDPDRAWGWPTSMIYHLITGWTHDPSFAADREHGAGTDSYREPDAVMPTMQICFHTDPTNPRNQFVEIDFDYASPLGGDIASLFVHAGEVVYNSITGAKTSQVRIQRMLLRRFKDVCTDGACEN